MGLDDVDKGAPGTRAMWLTTRSIRGRQRSPLGVYRPEHIAGAASVPASYTLPRPFETGLEVSSGWGCAPGKSEDSLGQPFVSSATAFQEHQERCTTHEVTKEALETAYRHGHTLSASSHDSRSLEDGINAWILGGIRVTSQNKQRRQRRWCSPPARPVPSSNNTASLSEHPLRNRRWSDRCLQSFCHHGLLDRKE